MAFKIELAKLREVEEQLGWGASEIVEALNTWDTPPDKAAWAMDVWNEAHQGFIDTATAGELVVWLGYRKVWREREQEKLAAIRAEAEALV